MDNIALEIPSVAYTNEITSPVENTTYSAKIGLMYANDYGFSVSPSGWTLTCKIIIMLQLQITIGYF